MVFIIRFQIFSCFLDSLVHAKFYHNLSGSDKILLKHVLKLVEIYLLMPGVRFYDFTIMLEHNAGLRKALALQFQHGRSSS